MIFHLVRVKHNNPYIHHLPHIKKTKPHMHKNLQRPHPPHSPTSSPHNQNFFNTTIADNTQMPDYPENPGPLGRPDFCLKRPGARQTPVRDAGNTGLRPGHLRPGERRRGRVLREAHRNGSK